MKGWEGIKPVPLPAPVHPNLHTVSWSLHKVAQIKKNEEQKKLYIRIIRAKDDGTYGESAYGPWSARSAGPRILRALR